MHVQRTVTFRRILATTAAAEKRLSKCILYVCVDLVIRHAMRMRHIVICDLSGCTVFFNLTSQAPLYSEKEKRIIEHKI